jgi:hypothetical protein
MSRFLELRRSSLDKEVFAVEVGHDIAPALIPDLIGHGDPCMHGEMMTM